MITAVTKYRPLFFATLAVIALPFGLYLLGLSLNTGTMVVALAIAAMGLNLCIGYTGLVSFGHGAWFGIGAYAAGLIQRNWFGGDILPAHCCWRRSSSQSSRRSLASSSCAGAASISRC